MCVASNFKKSKVFYNPCHANLDRYTVQSRICAHPWERRDAVQHAHREWASIRLVWHAWAAMHDVRASKKWRVSSGNGYFALKQAVSWTFRVYAKHSVIVMVTAIIRRMTFHSFHQRVSARRFINEKKQFTPYASIEHASFVQTSCVLYVE